MEFQIPRKTCFSSKSRKKVHVSWQLWAKVPVSCDFDFCFIEHHHNSRQYANLPRFSYKWTKKTNASVSICNLMAHILETACNFGTDVVLHFFWTFSTCNCIINKTLPQVFSCEFWEPATLLRTRLWRRDFLVILPPSF